METWLEKPVLLTGATGFVGRHLYPRLLEQDLEVVCASRNPERAAREYPDRTWVELDVERPETLQTAMEGCGSAYYLIHQMLGGPEYESRERQAARDFRETADEAGLERIVYLGGVAPKGRPSPHLRSRLETGRVLRAGPISAIELRASMIIGRGSASWQIVRDLAARLPAMILPSWTRTRTEPIWIGDVVEALIGALGLPDQTSRWFDIPGPETLTVADIMRRTAKILGNSPRMVDVPLLSPRLSSYWLRFVTDSDIHLARELVEGLKSDLLAESDEFWELVGHTELMSFEEAARREVTPPERRSARLVERVVHAMTGKEPTPES
jgi:uncharacterized protein YbjT (DUF2867 family)